MEKLFQLKKHNTNVRTEVIGGLTTFFAMAYIIFVNPNFLSQTGMDHTAVMLATCVSAAIGCFLTAFMANVPFAHTRVMGAEHISRGYEDIAALLAPLGARITRSWG